MPKPFKVSTWIPIVFLIIGMVGGAGAWAVAEHNGIEARAEAKVLRAEDRVSNRLDRLEAKIDALLRLMLDLQDSSKSGTVQDDMPAPTKPRGVRCTPDGCTRQ